MACYTMAEPPSFLADSARPGGKKKKVNDKEEGREEKKEKNLPGSVCVDCVSVKSNCLLVCRFAKSR